MVKKSDKLKSSYTDSLDKLQETVERINIDSSLNQLQQTINKINFDSTLSQIQKTVEKMNNLYSLNGINRIMDSINNYSNVINNVFTSKSLDNFVFYINKYNDIYNSVLIDSFKKINNIKYQEYIDLSTNIIVENLDRINKIAESFDFSTLNNSSKQQCFDNELLTTQIEAVPRYLSYAYANNSKTSLEEAYEKSTIKEIADMGNSIIMRIADINKLYNIENESNIYGTNCDDFGIIAVSIKDIADTDLKFKNLISMLYKGIYEFTNKGKNNILYELSKKNNIDSSGLDLIKWFRTIDEHSRDKTDKDKIQKVYSFTLELIRKKIPEKPSDYVKIQHAIYSKLLNLLNQIFEAMNASSE